MFLALEKKPQAAPEQYHSGRSSPCTLLRAAQMPQVYQILNLSSPTRCCWATSFCELNLYYIVKARYVFVKVMNKFTYFRISFLGFMKIPHSTLQPIYPQTTALCMSSWLSSSLEFRCPLWSWSPVGGVFMEVIPYWFLTSASILHL